jgi:hypothetical protein
LPGEQQSATIKVVIDFVDKTGFPWSARDGTTEKRPEEGNEPPSAVDEEPIDV